MSAPRDILVLADASAGRPSALTLEMLSCARELAANATGKVHAAAFGADESAQALIAQDADEVVVIALPEPDVEASVAALAKLSKRVSPTLVLIGHTAFGADVAPRLAFRLETAVAMGCVEIHRSAGKLLFTRARQGGIAREVLSFKTAPAVATLRAGSYRTVRREAPRKGRITALGCEEVAARVRVIERLRERDDGKLQLEDAKVVVAGGRGLDGPEGFRVLEALAERLGGAVGASRVPCDLGWCPRAWQIGLTGRTVTPDLYIAVGISGAGHHLAGCGNAKAIVAINTDASAAIFREARYGIVGDYRVVVPALIEALQSNSEPQMNADERR